MIKILFTLIAFSSVSVLSLSPYEQANWATLNNYSSALQVGNIADALTYVSSDVWYQIHALKRLVPIAGLYHGTSGATVYLSAFAANPPRVKSLDLPVIQNDTVLVTFTEAVTITSTSHTYSVMNSIIYTFDGQSKISYVDIFYDAATVAEAYCPDHFLVCQNINITKDNMLDTYHYTTPAGSSNLTSHEQINYQTLQTYLSYLGQGDIPNAITQTTDTVQYIMHALDTVVPTAGGTYIGHTGAENFFVNTSSYLSSFNLSNPLIRGLSNNTALVTFLEISTTKMNQSYQQVNNIIYVFDNSTNKISRVDIFFDSVTVGEAIQCQPGYRLECSKGFRITFSFIGMNLVILLVLILLFAAMLNANNISKTNASHLQIYMLH